MLAYISRLGTDSLRSFYQKRVEEVIAFIQSEYEELIREGGVALEDGKSRSTPLWRRHANTPTRGDRDSPQIRSNVHQQSSVLSRAH